MTRIHPVPAADVDRLWRHIEPVLRPAIATGSLAAGEVRGELAAGRMQLWSISEGADGLIVTSVGTVRNSETLACWVLYAAGGLSGGRRAIGQLMAVFEALARERGCSELRVESPRWGALKRLGFVRDGTLLRKAL